MQKSVSCLSVLPMVFAVFAGGAIAAQTTRNERISSKSGEYNAVSASDFADRWAVGAHEYEIGADGVARSLPALGALSYGEVPAANMPKQNDTKYTLLKLSERAISCSQGIASKAHDRSPECGPSPLAPAEIRVLVENAARNFNVDVSLATAIAQAESNFDQERNSSAGARGPMQLMPATAQSLGVTDICDPKANIEAGVKYLRSLVDEFQNPMLAVAAYNSGPDAVYQYGGVPPFKETVGYVAKVMNLQMGRSLPRKRQASAPPHSDSQPKSRTGVMAVEKTGNFVAGVMHF